MERKRPTASNVVPPPLTCIDGGRRDCHVAPQFASPSLSRPAKPSTERLSTAVWALFDSLEGRVSASEDRERTAAGEVATLRAELANAQRRVDELAFLQDGLEVRINELDAGEPRREPEPCPLSAREVEVLARLAEGKVYKQIALELCVSASTVRSHLHSVYGKIGAVDRAQAVLLASSRGWL